MFRQPSSKQYLNLFNLFLVLTLAMLLLPLGVRTAQAAPTELFFSEYIEGSSNNKALEIFNGTGAPIDLAAGGYNVQIFFNGSASAGLTINLAGTVADGDVFVLAHASADALILAQADQTNGAGWFNGDDAVVLRRGTDVLDVIGQVGFDPGTEWGSGLLSTADNTLRRLSTLEAGDPNGDDAFDPALEWEGFATNTFDGLGSHAVSGPVGDQAPAVASTTPANGATNVDKAANLQVTFSEPVDLNGAWFDLTCTVSGAHSAAVSGGPVSFTLDPDVDFANEDCTLTVLAAAVTDQDTDDPPDAMIADYTASFSAMDVCLLPYDEISAIQGSGPAAAITGPVSTLGVVVGDYEGPSPTLRGFYIQDLEGDGDPATSDGIFVFNGSNNSVSLGDVVRVSGNVSEFQDQTQISASSVVNCGAGSVSPVEVYLPVPSATFLEQYEGMLVTMPQTLYVTEHFQLGRFGQVVLSSGDRQVQPTNLVLPGADAQAMQAANSLNRIILDDDQNNQNPDPILYGRGGMPLSAANTLRGGDSVSGITGVLTYTWAGNSASGNAYRIRPINALGGGVPDFAPANPRPVAPEEVGGTLRVGAMNLLNYFNTFDGLPDNVDNCANGAGGEATDCRGADTAAEFDRQWAKTVQAILAMNMDVLGIVEIENDGYGPDSAIQDLVNKLNAASAPGTYAFIDVDAATEQVNALGTDAIKVGLLYKPAVVTPVGSTAALNTGAFGDFVTTTEVIGRNRPALAQTFQQNANGARFTAVVNHLKSKGSACTDNVSPVGPDPDLGDGQGNCNLTRLTAAQELAAWLAGDPTNTAEQDVLILGDLNSYAREDPIRALESAGYVNLIQHFGGDAAYSYVFDGQWGYLDHALGSSSLLSQVTGVTEYHINSDEPSVLDYNTDFKSAAQIDYLYSPDQYRVSDHDPVIVGLALQSTPRLSDLGFVTGGGWFIPTLGAYPNQPDFADKAQFQITAKYKKNKLLPDGNFTFRLHKAAFNFHCDMMDWLTVNQAHTLAIFSGTGTLNNQDGYQYMVWVGNGPDSIRIRIWNEDGVAFDNGVLQPIDNGSLVIHE